MSSPTEELFDSEFCFESYGVPVVIESNSAAILATAEGVARKALLQRLAPCSNDQIRHVFRLEQHATGECSIFQDGALMTTGFPDARFFRFFDSLVRVLVAEFCKSVVFIHSGVVAWKGRAILIPASSFSGKTSLVAELIRAGAEYYSDEYAVLDSAGLVHPFPRKLSVRSGVGTIAQTEVDASELGASVGVGPLPVGVVWFTKYTAGVREFKPEPYSTGQAVVEMINYTISIRRNPEFALEVLRRSLEGSTVLKCPRGETQTFVPFFLDFVDNTAI